MGLETRQRGGVYYYRKERIGGRVRSVYVASGELAVALCALDRETREGASADEGPDPYAADLAARVEAFCDEVTAALRSHMEASGYRRHRRGEWRKRRAREQA